MTPDPSFSKRFVEQRETPRNVTLEGIKLESIRQGNSIQVRTSEPTEHCLTACFMFQLSHSS